MIDRSVDRSIDRSIDRLIDYILYGYLYACVWMSMRVCLRVSTCTYMFISNTHVYLNISINICARVCTYYSRVGLCLQPNIFFAGWFLFGMRSFGR